MSNVGYTFTKVLPINVMLIGKTQVGKTGILGTLVDPADLSKGVSLYSDTYHPNVVSFILRDSSGAERLVNVVDTPGLGELKLRDGAPSRSSEAIHQAIIKLLRREISNINLICLVYKAGCLTKEDLDVYKGITTMYSEFSPITCLLITHGDQLSPADRTRHVEQLNNEIDLKELREMCKLGIRFSSKLPEIFRNYPDVLMPTINSDRNALIELIVRQGSRPGIPLSKFPGFGDMDKALDTMLSDFVKSKLSLVSGNVSKDGCNIL